MKNQITSLNKLVTLLIGLALMLFVSADVSAQRVEIYHKTSKDGGEYTKMKVGPKSLKAHLAHGDHLINCLYFPDPERHPVCSDAGETGFYQAPPLMEQEELDSCEQLCTTEETLPDTNDGGAEGIVLKM